MYVCDIHMVDRGLRMFKATVGATPFMTGKHRTLECCMYSMLCDIHYFKHKDACATVYR